MGDIVRVGPDLHEAMTKGDDSKPSSTAIRDELQQRGRVRMIIDSDTGEAKFEQNSPTGMLVSPTPDAAQATARNAQGMPINLSNAGPKDLVTLPGMGDSTAEVYEQMGLLRRSVTGGYEVVGAAQPQRQQQQDQQPKPDEKKPDAPAADLRGVKGTSEQTDAFLKTAEQGTSPAFVQGVLSVMAKNDGEVPESMVAEAANRLGMEPAAVREQIERAHAEYAQAGETAIRNVGVQSPEQFVADMKASNREAYHEAVSALASDRNLGPLQELARAWVKRADVTMVATLEKHGLETWQDPSQPGTVFIRTAGLKQYGYEGKAGSISVADAVKAGYISFS